MSDESEMERRIEQTIEHRLEVKAGYSPTLSRLRHQSDAENLAVVRAIEGEIAMRQNKERGCNCYPRGLLSMSAEDKAAIRQDHIDTGVHRMTCPMWVDPHPLFSRRGDVVPPSYTRRQERQDAEAEQVDR